MSNYTSLYLYMLAVASHTAEIYGLVASQCMLILGGGVVATGPAKRYAGRITPYVVLTCVVAASGGALFG